MKKHWWCGNPKNVGEAKSECDIGRDAWKLAQLCIGVFIDRVAQKCTVDGSICRTDGCPTAEKGKEKLDQKWNGLSWAIAKIEEVEHKRSPRIGNIICMRRIWEYQHESAVEKAGRLKCRVLKWTSLQERWSPHQLNILAFMTLFREKDMKNVISSNKIYSVIVISRRPRFQIYSFPSYY